MRGPVWTLPNALTLARGLAAAPIAYAIVTGRFPLALVLVFVAGCTDGLDGMLARRTGQTSDLGRLLDPIADKVLLVVTFVAVSLPSQLYAPLPWWLTAIAILRDVGIVAAAGVIYHATGFTGFTPTFLGKVNTVFELCLIGLFLITRTFGLPEPVLTAGVFATATVIVVSSVHYVFHARRQLAEFAGRPPASAPWRAHADDRLE